MSQSAKVSAIEIGVNIAVKFVTATLLWMAIREHAAGWPAIGVTSVFTANSFVFGYVIRRMFCRGEKHGRG